MNRLAILFLFAFATALCGCSVLPKNKLFVADNAMAVLSGRNIGDEYFMRSSENNFVDIDILAAGPVVPQLSHGFDEYWNSELSYPIAMIVNTSLDREALRERFDGLTSQATSPLQDTSVPERLRAFAAAPTWPRASFRSPRLRLLSTSTRFKKLRARDPSSARRVCGRTSLN